MICMHGVCVPSVCGVYAYHVPHAASIYASAGTSINLQAQEDLRVTADRIRLVDTTLHIL